MRYIAPHEVRDTAKLDSMIETLRNGGSLPAIVVCGDSAFTGSHRLAAWEACNVPAEVIVISDADYIAATKKMGLDWETDTVHDFGAFCAALYKITRDADVKRAIRDQRD